MPRSKRNPTRQLNEAIESGVNFILQSKSNDGLWRDFDTLAGESSEWVTAYILNDLQQISGNGSIDVAYNKMLLMQRSSGGWGYNNSVPPDADSTAWTILAFSSLPLWRPSSLIRAVRFVENHFDKKTGGFTTYIPKDKIDKYIGAANSSLTEGWLSPHTCVTAVTLQALISSGVSIDRSVISRGCSFLKKRQLPNLLWNSYWWNGYAYSTFHVLKALLIAKAVSPKRARQVIEKIKASFTNGKTWTEDRKPCTLFNHALYLRTILLLPALEDEDVALHAMQHLLKNQLEDGSWPSSPILRIPPPMMINPGELQRWQTNQLGTGVIIADQRKLFNTSTIVMTLNSFREIFSRSMK